MYQVPGHWWQLLQRCHALTAWAAPEGREGGRWAAAPLALPQAKCWLWLKCPKVTIHLSRCDDNNLQICAVYVHFCSFSTHAHFIMQQTTVRECHKITCLTLCYVFVMHTTNDWGRHLACVPNVDFHCPHVPWPLPPRYPVADDSVRDVRGPLRQQVPAALRRRERVGPLTGLPWGWHFNPHTHPIPTGIPLESPW